ncbi:hypothetical protein Nepgr_022694 [Nepenthes gracilis]|uniref:Cytochrome b561 domain-containing protein n=1 Tax=Nepenthes gracilis TaxID=150966 RepID=A0AAD3T2J1_NEPGR|nr:hypothetical protein Nepgr_022694 [Nepenthes gracilis]
MAILARPEKGTKWRKYWNWCHYFTGRMLMIFAVANAFYGIHLGMEGPSWTDAYAATLAVLFIAAVLLEFKMRIPVWRKRFPALVPNIFLISSSLNYGIGTFSSSVICSISKEGFTWDKSLHISTYF